MSRLGWMMVTMLGTGCAAALNVSGGALVATDFDSGPAPEGLLETHAQVGVQGLGLGVGGRTHAGENGFDLGVGPDVCYAPASGRPQLSVCAGASLLTLGYRHDTLTIGSLSPYIEPAVAFPMGDRTPNAFFVSLPVGYDLRFNTADGWYAGVAIGVGWAVNSGEMDD